MISPIRKMMMYSPKTVIYYAWTEFNLKFYFGLLKHSYSQSQEDIVIDKILGHKPRGFYVDIGANDPNRFSNTKRFYRRGWTGINIEPLLGKWQKLEQQRPNDSNLNIAIAAEPGTMKFYKMFPDTVSTLSEVEASASQANGLKLEEIINIPVLPLRTVFSKHSVKDIDFLSVDTEGTDLSVLKSNDWSRYRPKVICIESIPRHKSAGTTQQHAYLLKNGYTRKFHNETNNLYVDTLR